MSAAILGAQTKSSDNSAKTPDNGKNASAVTTVTYSGCLAPGTKSDSFYLTNAKQKGVKGAQAATVKVVPSTKKVDVNSFIAHEVEVTGTLDQAATPNSETAPTLSATKVKFGPGGAC
jgi:hypothetical protein